MNTECLVICVLFLVIFLLSKKEKRKLIDKKLEHFSNSNFEICDTKDCACLKLKTAPDGTCVKEDIPKIPEVPNYEDKVFYNKRAINNIKYPKKRKYDILIFVGKNMKNKTTLYNQKIPEIFESSFKTDYSIYSNHEASMELFEIFERGVDIISYFDNKTKPYLKYIILNSNNISKDRKIMKSYGLDLEKVPAIYLYNESTQNLKRFGIKKFNLENQCAMLERLLIFIADGDCGFLSYLNFLHDPFYGMKYKYHSKNKRWQPHLLEGRNPLPPGTGMCSLIDLSHLPEECECSKLQL
tara:strand:- start:1900 stop:2790 length:891 start_codon:yes stop_codon:yes gene_type:complete